MSKGIAGLFLDSMRLNSYEFVEFESVYEVVARLEEMNLREKEINADLLDCESRDDLSSKDINRIKKNYKKELFDLKREIDFILDLLTDYTTFDSKTILPFLAEYLSITEGETFGLMSDIVPDEEIAESLLNSKPVKLKGETYYLITTASNIEYLEKIRNHIMFNSLKNIREYTDTLNNDKFICLEKSKKINILDGALLDEYFVNFPNLKRLGYAIVNLQLRHPEFTDEDIFTTILDTVKRTQGITR